MAQVVRALAAIARGRWFESSVGHAFGSVDDSVQITIISLFAFGRAPGNILWAVKALSTVKYRC